MAQIWLVLSIALVITFRATADANSFSMEKAPIRSQSSTSRVKVGLGFRTMDYQEEVPLPLKSTESGLLARIVVDAGNTDTIHSNWLFGFHGALGKGTTTFDGSLQDGTPYLSKTTNTLLDIEGFTGLRSSMDPLSSVQVTLGLSLRLWKRDIGQGKDPRGYLEDYHMLILPLGFTLNQKILRTISIHPQLVIRPLVSGTVTAYLTKQGLTDIDLPLSARMGYRLALPIRIHALLDDLGTLVVIPYMEQTSIGEGAPRSVYVITSRGETGTLELHEPGSTNRQFGIDVQVSFDL